MAVKFLLKTSTANAVTASEIEDGTITGADLSSTINLPVGARLNGTAFGGAATLNVGTTAGTVAAGDDSRIVSAVQTSRTIAGLALSSDISASSLADAIGLNSTRTAIPDTGWTTATTGTASASISAGVHTLNVNANATVREYRATISTAAVPAIEVMGRFEVTTGNPATSWATSLWLSDLTEVYGFVVQVDKDGFVALYKGDSVSGMTFVGASSGTVSRTSLAWLRLVVAPTYAAAYYGSSGSSTPPTTWILASSIATTLSVFANEYMTLVSVRSQRSNTGSGTYTTQWRDLQWRILGVAP